MQQISRRRDCNFILTVSMKLTVVGIGRLRRRRSQRKQHGRFQASVRLLHRHRRPPRIVLLHNQAPGTFYLLPVSRTCINLIGWIFNTKFFLFRHLPSPMPGPSGMNPPSNIRSPSQPVSTCHSYFNLYQHFFLLKRFHKTNCYLFIKLLTMILKWLTSNTSKAYSS